MKDIYGSSQKGVFRSTKRRVSGASQRENLRITSKTSFWIIST
jgi:hypothetical protein